MQLRYELIIFLTDSGLVVVHIDYLQLKIGVAVVGSTSCSSEVASRNLHKSATLTSQNIEKLNDLRENTSEIEWLNLKIIFKL